MKNLRAPLAPLHSLLVAFLAFGAGASALGSASCASQDPGAYEITARRTGSPVVLPTTNPTGNPPPTDGGPPPATDSGTASFFPAAFTVGAGGVDKLQTVHMGNGGPTSIGAAGTSDCLGCHGASGTATNKFLAAGVVPEAGLEIGVKLANGTLRTTRSGAAPDTIFTVPVVAGDSITGAKTAVRSGTKEKAMTSTLTSGGCNAAGGCHGGTQGAIFK